MRSLIVRLVILSIALLAADARGADPLSNAEDLPQGVVATFGSHHFRAGGQLQSISLSNDGKILVTRNVTRVKLWQVDTGKRLFEFDSLQEGQTIAWSNDGSLLAGITRDQELLLIDGATGKKRDWKAQSPDKEYPQSIVIAPDNKAVAVGYYGRVRVYDTSNGKLLKELECPESVAERLIFREDGKFLDAFTSARKHIRWNWPGGEKEGEGSATYLKFFSPWDFNAQGHKFHASGKIINFYTPDLVQINTGGNSIEALGMSHNGKLIASGDRKGIIEIWETATKKRLLSLPSIDRWLTAIALSSDGSVLAAGGAYQGNRVRLWRIKYGDKVTATEILPDDGHEAGVKQLEFAHERPWLLSTSIDNTARIWDTKTRRQLAKVEGGYDGSLSRDGSRLAVFPLNAAREVKIYKLSSEPPALTGTYPGYKVALAPDGKTFATLGPENVKICDAENGTTLKELSGGASPVYELLWCAKAPLIACGGTGKVTVWNVESREKAFETSEASPHTLAFSSTGSHLVTARNPNKKKGPAIQVWDLSNGKLAREFGDERIMSCLVLSDNRRILAGELTGAISVWDLTTGKLLKRLPAHSAGVYALAESPDGQHFASGSIDSAIWLWDAAVLPK